MTATIKYRDNVCLMMLMTVAALSFKASQCMKRDRLPIEYRSKRQDAGVLLAMSRDFVSGQGKDAGSTTSPVSSMPLSSNLRHVCLRREVVEDSACGVRESRT
ncbi:hypothetical protein GE09DRAFT_1105705 [Coniochaeta sp. 2T2.1]|nr:hypothetical protein GE09DRAFT_1105705 [Coniochaeta sp. 2T2.1]